MIEQLAIHRFRGIRQGHLSDFGKINLFVGPNNSGKSAVLEMLYLSGVCGRECGLVLEDGSYFPANVPIHFDFLGYRPLARQWKRHGKAPIWNESDEKAGKGLTDEGGLWFRLKDLPEGHPLQKFRLAGSFTPEEVKTTAMFTLMPIEGGSEIEAVNQGDRKPLPAEIAPAEIMKALLPETARINYLWYPDFVFKNERKEPLDALAIWASPETGCNPERVLFFDFHTIRDNFLKRSAESFYYEIPDWREKIAQAMGKVFPEMAGCQVNTRPVGDDEMAGSVEVPGRKPLPIDDFGDGMRHAFKLLSNLIALKESTSGSRPGLFLWEEPELFMHPAALHGLLAQVVELVSSGSIQLFLSTHSVEVIAELVQIANQDKRLTEMLRAYRMGTEAGRLISACFHTENLLSWFASGKDPRFWGISTTALHCQMEMEPKDE